MFCFKFQRVFCPLPLPRQDPGTSLTTEKKTPQTALESRRSCTEKNRVSLQTVAHKNTGRKENITSCVFIRPRSCPVTSVLFTGYFDSLTDLMFDSHPGGKIGKILSKWFSTCNYVVTHLLVSPAWYPIKCEIWTKKKKKNHSKHS